jgi:hypothetical protein
MPTFTPRQLSEARAIARTGRPVKIIADGAAGGAEKRYTGAEAGFVAVRAVYREKKIPVTIPHGDVDDMRGEADTERAAHRERTLRVAYAALDFEPTEKTRVVDGQTFAVGHVERRYHEADLVAYVLVLRPV